MYTDYYHKKYMCIIKTLDNLQLNKHPEKLSTDRHDDASISPFLCFVAVGIIERNEMRNNTSKTQKAMEAFIKSFCLILKSFK